MGWKKQKEFRDESVDFLSLADAWPDSFNIAFKEFVLSVSG